MTNQDDLRPLLPVNWQPDASLSLNLIGDHCDVSMVTIEIPHWLPSMRETEDARQTLTVK